MATRSLQPFERKPREAPLAATNYPAPMIHNVMDRGDWLLLLALALIWGAAFLFIKVAVTHVEPLTYVWLRLGIAATALWLWLHWTGQRLRLDGKVWAAILLLALLNTAVPFALFGWAQTHIASGLASILNATTPIWGVIVAHAFTSDERLTPAKLVGVLLGFGGVAAMIGPDLLALDGDLLPQLACVAASLLYALAGVWARRFKQLGIAPAQVAAGQLLAGAAVMTPVALLVEQPWLDPLPPLEAWGAIVALALMCTALGYVLYFKLIDRAGATNALLVTLLVPPVAILLGALLLGEALSVGQFAGLALIALGLAAIDGRLLSRLSRPSLRQPA